jgi:hypothetical protein
MYKQVLESLAMAGDIRVTAKDGRQRRLARYMADTDIVEPSPQFGLFGTRQGT